MQKLFANSRVTMTTVGLIIATSVQNFGFYGIMSWMPTMIANELGEKFKDTTFWTISTTIGMAIGIVIFGWLCDKIGRRPAYLSFLIIAAVAIWSYFQQRDIAVLIVFGAILVFFVNGMIGGFGALLAEHYQRMRDQQRKILFLILVGRWLVLPLRLLVIFL